ncbi:hypothetical protein BD770DRAFT_386691 [Pilaira anomala]|nr:hypothetical protein BD770DRAFT_386691 [Pilaira anomala]
MSYTTTEKKRQSIYSCIRYATNLMKVNTDIRKHRALSNNVVPITPKYDDSVISQCCYGDLADEEEIFDEKFEQKYDTINIKYSSRRESQLALPSRNTYVTHVTNILCEKKIDNGHDEEEEDEETTDNESMFDDLYDDDDDSDFDSDLDSYYMEDEDSVSAALKKLSGIVSKPTTKVNRAVLITLSPSSLAAANAARQRRQKFRINR